jgi:hypothetical protein
MPSAGNDIFQTLRNESISKLGDEVQTLADCANANPERYLEALVLAAKPLVGPVELAWAESHSMASLDPKTRVVSVPRLSESPSLIEVAKSRAGFEHELAHFAFSPAADALGQWWDIMCAAAAEDGSVPMDVLPVAFQMLEDLRIERRAHENWESERREWLRFNALSNATAVSVVAHAGKAGWTTAATTLAGRTIAGSVEDAVYDAFVALGPGAKEAAERATPIWREFCNIDPLDENAPSGPLLDFAKIPDLKQAVALLPPDAEA